MSKNKKKLKDTAVGKFLAGAGSNIIGSLGEVLPDKGILGIVKNLIKKDPTLPAEDKEKALAWQADMRSDSWLSKNTRPLTLVFLTISMVLLIFIDSTGLDFEVDGGWVDLLKSLLITVYVAYFGSRGAEKFKSIQNK